MTDNVKYIIVNDCLQFNNSDATFDVLQTFIETQQNNVFRLANNYKTDEVSILAEYNYFSKNWIAGRFVGESFFYHKNQAYKITIKPRFGEDFLFRMIEEIFNIRITKSTSNKNQTNEWQHYIKRIIAFIWVHKLANANLHGLPRIQIKKQHKGVTIKGRINIRKSIIPYYTSNEVISVNREKQIDNTIAKILFQAYQIIRKDFDLGKGLNIPETAQNAINQIGSLNSKNDRIVEADYLNIKYNNIYANWKSIVDFSWDIIKRKQISLKQQNSVNGFGFFIDIAEVWELYLRSLLQKRLKPLGWYLKTEKQIAYKKYFFERELIPDIVFEKNNKLLVYDAKYKRMLGRSIDVDRSDFFQIHTYIQNYLNKNKVKAGGLLYPISARDFKYEDYTSSTLMHKNGLNINFSIDGIELIEKDNNVDFKEKETQFINRVIKNL